LRQSREAARATRQRIVKAAARAFRKQGFAGVGIADLMARSGLTHGGFYKHFASKDALAAEACSSALDASRQALIDAMAGAPKGRRLEAMLDSYLSMAHRDNPGYGCAIAALAAESGRLDTRVRAVIAEGYDRLVALLAAEMRPGTRDDAEQRARPAVATMVGAMVVARTIADRPAAEQVLAAAREQILSVERAAVAPERH
jgi:TetR/AcrR family transcriptional regulator, transcriptional repressor for nem operon